MAPVQSQERALLVAPCALDALDGLLSIARPLAGGDPGRELIVAGVVEPDEVGDATARLAGIREQLIADGVATRTAAFSSPAPGDDVARLASQEAVDLLLLDTGEEGLEEPVTTVLERAPCDVALLVRGSAGARQGPVVVPFGAGFHDWAALELGTWFACANGGPLRLVGAADRRRRGRDASRLLADASLIVQRTAGIVAEPVLTQPGREGVAEAAAGRSPAGGGTVRALARGRAGANPGQSSPGSLRRRPCSCGAGRAPAAWRPQRRGPASAGPWPAPLHRFHARLPVDTLR